MNIMKIMSLIQKEGEALKLGNEFKEICIKSIDVELNIGRDRAEEIVIKVMNEFFNFMKEKGII